MITKYKSKIDLGLIIFIIIILLTSIYFLITDFKIGGLITILIVSSFLIYLFNSTYYSINNSINILSIKCGFLVNLQIDIFQIKEIKHVNNWISSPALSLDRIEIFYNKYDSVIISPKNKNRFVQELKLINPEIIANLIVD